MVALSCKTPYWVESLKKKLNGYYYAEDFCMFASKQSSIFMNQYSVEFLIWVESPLKQELDEQILHKFPVHQFLLRAYFIL